MIRLLVLSLKHKYFDKVKVARFIHIKVMNKTQICLAC